MTQDELTAIVAGMLADWRDRGMSTNCEGIAREIVTTITAAERERCAKIAETWSDYSKAAEAIAEAIRAGL